MIAVSIPFPTDFWGKNIRKAYFFAILLLNLTANSQTLNMCVHHRNGTVIQIPINMIDSITHGIDSTAGEKTIELLVNGSPTGGNFTFFSFAEGKEISAADSNSVKWDFALRFETFIVNSKASGPGNAYAQVVSIPFSEIKSAVFTGWKQDTSATQRAIKGSDWYVYNNITRQLSPIAGKTFLFITAADSKFAKMEVVKLDPADDNGNIVTPPFRPTKIKYILRYFYQKNGTPYLF